MLVRMPRPEPRDRSADDGDALGNVLAAQKRYYDLRAPDYAVSEKPPDRAGRNPFPSELVEPIFEDLGPVGDVLEFACGPGPLFTRELARHADSVTAVDASPTMLRLNQTRVADPNVTYIEADLFDWSSARTYDFVFFGHWLSHVPSARFDEFWELVRTCTGDHGRVGFIDEDERAASMDADRPSPHSEVAGARSQTAGGSTSSRCSGHQKNCNDDCERSSGMYRSRGSTNGSWSDSANRCITRTSSVGAIPVMHRTSAAMGVENRQRASSRWRTGDDGRLRPEEIEMNREEIDRELAEADEVLASTSTAHLAYTGIDGTPRVVVVGFYSDGKEFVISTAATAPKVAALLARPEVALAIDTGDTPGGACSLSVRGTATVEIIDGVVPEYLAAARRSMDADAAAKFEQNVRRMYDRMARIAIAPSWARFFDFGAGRMPRFLQELAARSHMTEADWAD
jgi:hypothetical protein